MKCQICSQETDGWCRECDTRTLCYKLFRGKHLYADRVIESHCCLEPNHHGPCSPMHCRVFSREEQLKHAFGSEGGAHADYITVDEHQEIIVGQIDTGTPLVTPREMTGEMVGLIVDSIVKDLLDRSGLEDAWDEIDEELREEITEEWREIINSCWLRGCP